MHISILYLNLGSNFSIAVTHNEDSSSQLHVLNVFVKVCHSRKLSK